MKSILKHLTLILSFMILFSCGREDLFNILNNKGKGSFDNSGSTGDIVTVDVGDEKVPVKFIYAKDSSDLPLTFPVGEYDEAPGTITKEFFMSETVVTTDLFKVVLEWACVNDDRLVVSVNDAKYDGQELIRFPESGIICTQSMTTLEDGPAFSFGIETGHAGCPVVNVTVYGAMIFCNWLTEMIDEDDSEVVYNTDSWTARNKTGFRLPTDLEWEYAARYLDGKFRHKEGAYDKLQDDWIYKDKLPKYIGLTEGHYWTPGSYASGALTCFNDLDDSPKPGEPAGKYYNDKVAVYSTYYCVFGWEPILPTPVLTKVKSTERSNQLGLYDMSGNVWEFCQQGATGWAKHGGSFRSDASELQVGRPGEPQHSDHSIGDDLGFRIAKTK